jgi:hypothetical protein
LQPGSGCVPRENSLGTLRLIPAGGVHVGGRRERRARVGRRRGRVGNLRGEGLRARQAALPTSAPGLAHICTAQMRASPASVGMGWRAELTAAGAFISTIVGVVREQSTIKPTQARSPQRPHAFRNGRTLSVTAARYPKLMLSLVASPNGPSHPITPKPSAAAPTRRQRGADAAADRRSPRHPCAVRMRRNASTANEQTNKRARPI